eukprot:Seg4816.2 transcript_id=Seg4816.2/GoldUCD/mRNA.D3Y31 product="hypothetical protein" protein_id=Seg4816.2/GoldUCD/D3Y31
MRKLDLDVRQALRKHHHVEKHASVARLYLPREEGGRGLVNLEDCYGLTMVAVAGYVLKERTRADPFLEKLKINIINVEKGDGGLRRCTIFGKARKVVKDLGLTDVLEIADGGFVNPATGETILPSQAKTLVAEKQQENRRQKWLGGRYHGVFKGQLEGDAIELAMLVRWLVRGVLKPRTEGYIAAIQEGNVHCNAFVHRVIDANTKDTCRRCDSGVETIGHILSGCKSHGFYGYMKRHNEALCPVWNHLATKAGIPCLLRSVGIVKLARITPYISLTWSSMIKEVKPSPFSI